MAPGIPFWGESGSTTVLGSCFLDVPKESSGANSTPSPADDAGVGVYKESRTRGVDSVAVGFRNGDVFSVGAAAGPFGRVSMGLAGFLESMSEHPPRLQATT